MPLETVKRYTLELVQSRPEAWFVFGDNMAREGRGGQAAACRDQPNTIGIPTKWLPKTTPTAYLSNADFWVVQRLIFGAVVQIRAHLLAGHTVVFPEDGIGTGLAQLEKRAPIIWDYLQGSLEGVKEFARKLEERP